MEVGRGARRLAPSSSAGCSWASFEETAKDYGMSGKAGGRERCRRGERKRSPRGKFVGGGEGGLHRLCVWYGLLYNTIRFEWVSFTLLGGLLCLVYRGVCVKDLLKVGIVWSGV